MKSYKLITEYFVENRLRIFLGIICLMTVDMLQLMIPRVIKWVVDDLTAFQIDVKQLFVYAVTIIGIALGIAVFRYIWRRCLIGTSRRIEEGLRNKLFSHIQTLSASYFNKARTGNLMAHATNDIKHVRMATGMGMVALTDAIFLGTTATCFMAYINIRLTVFVLIPMPLIVLCTRFFSKKMHYGYQAVQSSFSEMTEVVREQFAGIRIIKAYNRQTEETAKLETVSKQFISENLGLIRIIGLFFPMMILFTNISMAIVIYLGGSQTITATITTGDFVAFISYLGLMTWPMMALGWVTNLIQRGAASLDRIDKILKTKPEIKDMPDAGSIKQIQGEIVFEHVSFSYNRLPVLKDINVKLSPGKTLGIIGPPGSGKTTLLNLVPRLYDVHAGRILIDGTDIRTIKIQDLRSVVTFMPQEPFLFAGSIRDNIIFGNQHVSEKRVIEAAKKACLYDTIKSFSDGFDTIVGEKGIILSGGQKQRVALARALMRDTPLLILDDPISQVDFETSADIISTLKSLSSKKTIIIVSHRLSAIQHADHIITLTNGSITEAGTHTQLVASGNYYERTFYLQEIEEY